jgi:hypothetical protein
MVRGKARSLCHRECHEEVDAGRPLQGDAPLQLFGQRADQLQAEG